MWRRRRVIKAESAAIAERWEAVEDSIASEAWPDNSPSIDEIWASTGCDLEHCLDLLQSLEALQPEAALNDPEWPGALDLLAFYELGDPLPDSALLPTPWTAGALHRYLSEVASSWGLTYHELVASVVTRIQDLQSGIEERDAVHRRRRRALEREVFLPTPEQLDRLIRAEAHLDRRFAKV